MFLNCVRSNWLIQAFSDPRYITRNGRPVFLVYRPNDLPNPQGTTDLFRSECLRAGLAEPYLIGINGHVVTQDARSLGFDATLHFMPQLGILENAFVDGPSNKRAQLNKQLGVEHNTAKVYDYKESMQQMLALRESLGHETIPSIFVGWDNTPRRAEDAIVLTGSQKDTYQATLEKLVGELGGTPHEERLLFINAWNEWAEGNHLEPDQAGAHQMLDATLNTLKTQIR